MRWERQQPHGGKVCGGQARRLSLSFAYRLRWLAFFVRHKAGRSIWRQRSRADNRCRCGVRQPRKSAGRFQIILPLLAPTTAPIISTMAATETSGSASVSFSVLLPKTLWTIKPKTMGNKTFDYGHQHTARLDFQHFTGKHQEDGGGQ